MHIIKYVLIAFSFLSLFSTGCAESARPQTAKQALTSASDNLPDKTKQIDTSALRAFYQKRINEHQQEKKALVLRRSLESTQKARMDALRLSIKQKHAQIQHTHASWKNRMAK